MIADLPDDRRAGKPGLPADDRDVTNGLVVEDEYWDGRPDCVRHGAMNRVDQHRMPDGALTYRCQMCGVGAKWWPSKRSYFNQREQDYDEVGQYVHPPAATRQGQEPVTATSPETEEQYAGVLNREDELGTPAYGEVFHEVVIRYRWSDISIPEGLMERIEDVDQDPVGAATDSYLQPMYETDEVTVLTVSHKVELDEIED